MITIPINTASNLLANVTGQLSDAGTLLVVVLAAGIPLAFYVIRRLIGLVPKDKDDKESRADKNTIKYLKRLRDIEHY
jgi:hypothetical protein